MAHNQERNPRAGGGRGRGGGGSGGSDRLILKQSSGACKKFPKEISMRSFHATHTHTKQEHQKAEKDRYLQAATPTQDMISAKLVFPTGEFLPSALDDPRSLDEVRVKYQVWINFEAANILAIYGRTSAKLQEAIQAIHWTIHDMRLSDEQDVTRFFLQERVTLGDNRLVRVLVGNRPCVVGENEETLESAKQEEILAALWEDLGADLSAAAETLMGLGKDLDMHVNFGRLNVRRKEKGSANEFTHEQFRKLLKPYGRRGNASLGKSMPDGQMANAILETLMDPIHGVEYDATSLTTRHTLTLITEQGDFEAKLDPLPNAGSSISSIRGTLPEEWPRLDWTVATPDMLFDWNLEVKAHKKLQTVPSDLATFLQKLKIQCPKAKANGGMLMLPRLITKDAKHPDTKVSACRMKSSTMMTLSDGKYAVEVSITRAWDGVEFDNPSTFTWEIELFGSRWEEAINTVGSNGMRKDWGKDLIEIWPGSDPSLESRFKNFLRNVLKIQALLTRVGLDANKDEVPKDDLLH